MWDNFIFFAVAALMFWIVGAWAAWKDRIKLTYGATIIGIIIFFAYILMMWITLQRPPLRTMGETRLWYSLFLPLAGIIIYSQWRYKWLLSFSTIMALVFICINIFKPEIHSKVLMPALQSPWFAPHVIVYMFAYSLFGLAALFALGMLLKDKVKLLSTFNFKFSILDNLVYVGYALLTFGMLMGALWAKECWGHYWSWDPKETWAAITWFSYLGYIHVRRVNISSKYSLVALIVAFCLLQMCWWGVNYLPSAEGMSVHTYSMQ